MAAEEMHTVAELAKAWRVSPTYVYELISSGELPATNLGHGRAKIRVSETAVAEYLASKTTRAPRRLKSAGRDAA